MDLLPPRFWSKSFSLPAEAPPRRQKPVRTPSEGPKTWSVSARSLPRADRGRVWQGFRHADGEAKWTGHYLSDFSIAKEGEMPIASQAIFNTLLDERW